jgi:response regulator NasT
VRGIIGRVTDEGTTGEGPLRILAADEDEAALRHIAGLLGELGHEVTSLAVDVRRIGEHVVAEDPDASVVVVQRDWAHALDLISEISSYATGPVIALLEEDDPTFVRAAADRGISAFARGDSAGSVQSAIELARRRHAEAAALTAEVARLQSALDRRAIIERAKGMLMERRGLDDRAAFELLRGHARHHRRAVVDTAQGVLDGEDVVPAGPDPGA